ncbi:hypothetical protein C4K18_2745 [Pseudomonas chlororaphis subsp. aurantiaca]|nr:hypothetical protein C4K18_2745 [Pseudomonas chlororaphis subsp. aurantiaca]
MHCRKQRRNKTGSEKTINTDQICPPAGAGPGRLIRFLVLPESVTL